jgi:hypothetical protein
MPLHCDDSAGHQGALFSIYTDLADVPRCLGECHQLDRTRQRLPHRHDGGHPLLHLGQACCTVRSGLFVVDDAVSTPPLPYRDCKKPYEDQALQCTMVLSRAKAAPIRSAGGR